jgi:hypothetical protein
MIEEAYKRSVPLTEFEIISERINASKKQSKS